MNNILSPSENNHLFLASVIAVLCEKSPITLDLRDIEKFWSGQIIRLQYNLEADEKGQRGSITFSLKDVE